MMIEKDPPYGPGHPEWCPGQAPPNEGENHSHCEHWFDGETCCWCAAPEMTQEERIAQGCDE